MTTLPLGLGAYKRASADAPEVKLINRFVEKSPTNLKEHVALLSRPGSALLQYFAADTATGSIRKSASQLGVFNDDLFVISGKNLYRYDGTTVTQISGQVQGSGAPSITFVKGAGYQRMFIADGLLLQYYGGGSQATGTLTDDGSATYTTATIAINGVYYGWNSNVNNNSPNGTAAHPFLCLPGTDHASYLANMVNMLNFTGIPGTDFSSALTGRNIDVSATSGALTLVLTSRLDTTAGNLVTTTVQGDSHLSFGSGTLTGGGVQSLHGVTIPTGDPALAVSTLNSYVFVALGGTRQIDFIKPGEVIIDPLLFASKESAPDNLVDVQRVGDVMVVMGSKSVEFWSATGDSAAPFAPIQGRTLSRGVIPGTAVAVDESTIILVGDDMKVYSVAGIPTRISDHGIEERIRRQIRREAGLTS